MSERLNHMYNLLPVVYRQRDASEGFPLKALMRIINEQAKIIEDDISALYENWFIETSDDWVVPYIADLIGYQPVHEAGEPQEVIAEKGRLLNKILIPRREVANTIRNRRRKGTLALLELLARDVANWPARAVEFFTLVSQSQPINHLRCSSGDLSRGKTVDLRKGDALSRINGPFDEIAHTIDVRRPNSLRTPGRYNIPSIGLFVWRLRAYSVQDVLALNREDIGMNFYTFSILGNDISLFSRPIVEDEPTQIAGELNLPAPIRRKALDENKAAYYGEGKSILIWIDNAMVSADKVIAADLSGWFYSPPEGFVAIDPELGRIALPRRQLPKQEGIRVSYYYGFSADAGGGEYTRPLYQPTLRSIEDILLGILDVPGPADLLKALRDAANPFYEFIQQRLSVEVQTMLQTYDEKETLPENVFQVVVADLNSILQSENIYNEKCFKDISLSDSIKGMVNLNPVGQDMVYVNRLLMEAGFAGQLLNILKIYRVGRNEELTELMQALNLWRDEGPRHAVIELTDNSVYVEPINIELAVGQTLQIRAANRTRPTIKQLDWKPGAPDAINVTGMPGSRFALDGLLITGRGIKVEGDLDELNIRHCTLVPGWAIDEDCQPKRPAEKSIILYKTGARVKIEHSIIGSIQVIREKANVAPIVMTITDSVLDATDFKDEVLSEPDCEIADVTLSILRTTVIGEIHTHAIQLGENCIFMGKIAVARRQTGCIRFSYIVPGSRTPRRYNCQPDLVVARVVEELGPVNGNRDAIERAQDRERNRVVPQFNSIRYGQPKYCQLSNTTAEEIKRGADDESEMGVFHDLFQPQREANLRIRLEEYTPAGMNAGIIFAS